MAAPERFAESQICSCNAGTVHTWPEAAVRCSAAVRPVSGPKRKSLERAQTVRITQTGPNVSRACCAGTLSLRISRNNKPCGDASASHCRRTGNGIGFLATASWTCQLFFFSNVTECTLNNLHFIDGSLAFASPNHACRILFRLFRNVHHHRFLTTAACGGLRSTPDCRTRRTYLHLPYSYASPCGPALLVTQDPTATFDGYPMMGA